MTEIRYVKDLIKYLADFNPNAEIIDNIDIGWAAPDCEGERDIESEKLNTSSIQLCGDSENVR
jgi:hypothetical protein